MVTSILVGEILIVLVGLAAAGLLVREYLMRKQKHLLFFALAILSVTVSVGALFGGQALYFHEPLAAGAAFAWFDVFIAAHLFLIFAGLIDIHARNRKLKPLFSLLAAAGAITLAASLLVSACQVVLYQGLAMCASSSLADSLAVSAYLFAMIVAFVFCRWLAKRRAAEPDFHCSAKVIAISTVAAALFVFINLLSVIFRSGPLFFVALAALLAHLVLLATGAIAHRHPDPGVVAKPFDYFRRSLVFKTAIITAGLFWVVLMAATVVTLFYFTRSIVSYRDTTIGHRVTQLAERFEEQRLTLLQTAELAAADPIGLAAASAGALPPKAIQITENYLARGFQPVVRVLNADGTVLIGGVTEKGITLPAAGVVGQAIGGKAAAAMERDNLFDHPVLRAAVPVAFDDGSHGILLVSAEYASSAGMFSDAALPPIAYGLVAADGRPISVVGQALSEEETRLFAKTAEHDQLSLTTLADGTVVASRPLLGTGAAFLGRFVYVLDAAATSNEIMRVFSIALFLDLLALIVMAIFLFWSERSLLRPISELQAAARAIEYEDYTVRVRYDARDELGEMAAAFNKMSQTIAERTESLRQALREQNDFLANTAHEILTPLNVIRWTLDMMRLGDTGRLTREQMELLEQMHQTASRLAGLVQNLIEAAKMEQGKVALKRAPLAVEDAIDEVAGMLSIKAREKQIALQWKRPKEPLPPVSADRGRLTQVILNIMNNAVKYTGAQGRITVAVSLADKASPDGQAGKFVQVSVQDTGRGIPKADQSKIFSRFFRASNVAKDDIEGAGLGLYIVSKLVELHGGRIWFASEEGKGTTFSFTIPIDQKM